MSVNFIIKIWVWISQQKSESKIHVWHMYRCKKTRSHQERALQYSPLRGIHKEKKYIYTQNQSNDGEVKVSPNLKIRVVLKTLILLCKPQECNTNLNKKHVIIIHMYNRWQYISALQSNFTFLGISDPETIRSLRTAG